MMTEYTQYNITAA